MAFAMGHDKRDVSSPSLLTATRLKDIAPPPCNFADLYCLLRLCSRALSMHLVQQHEKVSDGVDHTTFMEPVLIRLDRERGELFFLAIGV